MEKTGRNARRRVVRKVQGDRTRLESLVADYVQNKYGGIYDEACQFHDMLRELYPYKKDLKKTPEYKVWRNNTRRDLTRQASPLPLTPDRTEHVYNDKLQLRIPLLNDVNIMRKSTETLETSTEETPAVGVVESTETLETSTEETPAVGVVESTETLETLVEETLTVDVIQASLNEEIPPEMIDKIINELRDEPDLQDIFSSIEEQIQFEQLGMDLEMLEDDLLEKELLYS